MAQYVKTLKTFTFYEEVVNTPVVDKAITTASTVTFRDAYRGYVIKRVCGYAFMNQGANCWKFQSANPIMYHVVDTVVKEQPEGWEGYFNLYINKGIPDSIVSIVNTTGTLVNEPKDIIFPYGQDIEVEIPVIDNICQISFVARWSLRNTNLDATAVNFYGWINLTIEY